MQIFDEFVPPIERIKELDSNISEGKFPISSMIGSVTMQFEFVSYE